MSTIRFCLVGAGRAGLVHAHNVAGRIPNATLSALCDADADVLQQVGRELGVTALFQDYREAVVDPNIDAAIIVTPTFVHCDITCAAARAGKHVFLEKPMAISVAECETINEAVAESGVKLQIGFMRRLDERFLRAKATIDAGDMGRVMVVKSTGRGPGLPPPWFYDLARSNGVLAEVNSHDFDSVRWFAGSEVCRVYADGANFKCPEALEDFPEFYDNAIVNLRFENGVLGVIDGACPAHYGYDARMEILCEKGVVFVGSAQQHGVSTITVDDPSVTGVGTLRRQSVTSWRNLFKDAYLAEMECFITCILEDGVPAVTGLDGLRAVEAVVAANQSLLSGTPVDLVR